MREDNGRQGQTRPREGEFISQRRQTCGESREDKTSGRRIQHKTHRWGDNGRQEQANNERQWETRGDKTSGRRTHHPTEGNKKQGKGRQDLGKAGTPSNKGKQEGRQRETRLREGGRTIQHHGGHLKKALRTSSSTLFGELSRQETPNSVQLGF